MIVILIGLGAANGGQNQPLNNPWAAANLVWKLIKVRGCIYLQFFLEFMVCVMLMNFSENLCKKAMYSRCPMKFQ